MSTAGGHKYTPIFFLSLAVWLMLVWGLSELGMWQLRRAAEKQSLMEDYQSRVSLDPLSSTQLKECCTTDLRYRRVRIRGQFDGSHQFLLDNQVLRGHAGYHVLAPFWVENSDRYILVNRGWIPQGASREHLPVLTDPRGVRDLTGMLDNFPSTGLRLKGAEIATEGWPSVLQVLNAGSIAVRLGKPVYPLQLLLDPGVEEGYAREWRPADLVPEKNKGYAFQWFSLAALTAGYAILWGWRRVFRRVSV